MADPVFALAGRRVWVAGHRGMVGSALVRRLAETGAQVVIVDRNRVDLRRQAAVEQWLSAEQPDVIVVAAARVGGIHANDQFPATFLYDNLMIEANIIKAAADQGVAKLLFLGSSCIYPKFAEQPIREEALLTGPLEPTNEWYAIAKIAGIKLCQAYRRQFGCDFISAMPTNLYGPGDNYHPQNSHVIPALLRKAVQAQENGDKSITVWGSGTPRREFLHVDDLADALVFLLCNYSECSHINVGFGKDVTIAELAQTVCDVVGFDGDLRFDKSMPDGTPRKLMDSSRLLAMGWTPHIGLTEGLTDALRDFRAGGRARGDM